VQQTADGVVVLLHDGDLKRVAGIARKCGDLTFEEIRKLDVGSWFGPAFAGERVPSLAEVIELSRGHIRLNIELKPDGSNPSLAPAVAHLVTEHQFESECLITSFSYDVLLAVKQHDAHLRTGLIVAYALGDVSRLNLDALSVQTKSLSDDLIRSAHRAGQEVHVWTVNDPRQMDRLIKRGVDNIITDDPDILIRVRDEWTSLTHAERLVGAARLLLGLDRRQ
jgi:glycerophosphoryl diester phosphodiesterase